MLKTVLKWGGIVVGGIVALALLAAGWIYVSAEMKLSQTYTIPAENVTIPTDAESLKRGEYIMATMGGCRDCHGANLAGQLFIPDPVGPIYTANITSGKGGIGGMSDADLVRALRHGVRRDGKSVIVMPAEDFYNLNDADLGALIAYLRSVPPVDNEIPERQLGPIGRLLVAQGSVIMPASVLKHDQRPPAPERGVTAEYGKYLASVACMGCHGTGLSGGLIPGAPPDFPPSRNLTPAGNLKNWTEAQFINTIRTGITPENYNLPNAFMPWENLGQLTDDDLKAIWAFLQTVPAKETGGR